MTGQARVRVALKLYASLADYLPAEARKTHRLELELPGGTTVADVIAQHNLPPEARRAHRLELELAAGTTVADVIAQQSLPLKLCHLVLVNGYFIPPGQRATRPLDAGDELAIWPPIAGG